MGLTKLDIANYYAAMVDRILPHVVERPLSVVRCPGGAAAKCFYQKHRAEGMTDAIDTVRVKGKTETEDYIVIHDATGLLELVQFGSLEFHPWGSRTDDLERPDRLIFDLDPDPTVGWKDVVGAAVETRDLLEELGLKSFVKTTGGKGLHVVVPIAPGPKWPEVKTLLQAGGGHARRPLAQALHDQHVQEAAQGPHLHRLPAQRTRLDGRCRLHHARPRRRHGGDTVDLEGIGSGYQAHGFQREDDPGSS